MKKALFSLFLSLSTLLGIGVIASISPLPHTQKISVQYGHKRPFSFYYPYRYQYYYPRPEYYQQNRGQSCYWLYTNGTYVYYCR